MKLLDNKTFLTFVRGLGAVCGLVVVALAGYSLADGDHDPKSIVLDLYRAVFGILIVIAELRLNSLLEWFTFLVTFIGLGGFYVFVGGLALGSEWYEIIVAVVVCVIGVFYCALGCCCKPMEEDYKNVAANNAISQP